MIQKQTFSQHLNECGFKRPKFTTHFIQRYVQRIFNVEDPDYVHSYLKHKHRQVYGDALNRILKAERIFQLNTQLEKFLEENYSNNQTKLYFRRNNTIFVTEQTRDEIRVVTCFNGKDSSWLKK